MKRSPKQMLAVLAMAGLTMVAAPAAHAADVAIHGGCFLAGVNLGNLTSATTAGYIGDLSVTENSDGSPASAAVTCWVDVNGAPATPAFTYSGTGVQAGQNQIAMNVTETDAVQVCQQVAYSTGTTSRCDLVTQAATPSQSLYHSLDPLWDVTDWSEVTDPTLCPIFVELAGNYGPVTIEPDGDVIVADPIGLLPPPLYDCPPFGNSDGPPQPVSVVFWLPAP